MSSKVVIVTGASSGIGRACAERLHGAGHRVYGLSRRPDPEVPYRGFSTDVRDDRSVDAAVEAVLGAEGRIEVVVNAAGSAWMGAVEDTSSEEAFAQFDTNFFGVHRVCRAVLPRMRARGEGLIVNIGSIAGIVALPFQGFYTASKFALEGYSEALRMEVAPFGIRVALVEPGNYRTQLTASRLRAAASRTNPAYQDRCRHALEATEAEEQGGRDADEVAVLVERLVAAPGSRLRYRCGSPAERLAPALKSFLPYRLFERIVMGHYGV